MSLQGIKTAFNKASKTSYKHLNYEEKRLIKIEEELERVDKFLDYLWTIPPRKPSCLKGMLGAVDWKKFEKEDPENYNLLCDQLKLLDKLTESKNRLIAKYKLNVNDVYKKFRDGQFSLSQSY